jgi:hypothetical protein
MRADVIGCILVVLAAVAASAEENLPSLIDERVLEINGAWDGQPFWARLLPADTRFGGKRMLQLLYSPPSEQELGGARLVDCPFVLLDAHARVVAWNGRDGLSQATPAPGGYRVVREVTRGEGEAAHGIGEERMLRSGLGWDVHLAPVLLALTWKSGGSVRVPVIDLFGQRAEERLSAAWNGERAELAGEACTIEGDARGFLLRLKDAHGKIRLEISARHPLSSEASP